MANLKELRKRIVSVSSTMQITSAMKMVSAAKLKKSQDAIQQMRPYANKLQEILQNLSASLETSEGVYSNTREVKKVLLVVITSNRGLCGAFNANVAKQAKRSLEAYKQQGVPVEVLTIGKKGNDAMKKLGLSIMANRGDLLDAPQFAAISEVAQMLMNAYAQGTYDKIEVIYNQFKNAGVQITQNEGYLPVSVEQGKGDTQMDYIFEPGKMEIVDDLIPKSLKTQLFKCILDSIASEHGARMTAMHKATDNAKELNRNLKLDYNKARQAAITNEILEIVGGAAALNG